MPWSTWLNQIYSANPTFAPTALSVQSDELIALVDRLLHDVIRIPRHFLIKNLSNVLFCGGGFALFLRGPPAGVAGGFCTPVFACVEPAFRFMDGWAPTDVFAKPVGALCCSKEPPELNVIGFGTLRLGNVEPPRPLWI